MGRRDSYTQEMRILITNHQLESYAGSELYTYDISRELKRRCHTVVVYSPFLGKIASRFLEAGIEVLDDISKLEGEKFDVIHAHHNITAIQARSVFPETPMVFTSHGVLPRLEQPPSIELGIAKFVAVSEEVKANLLRYNIEEEGIVIIRNFVDLARFKPSREIRNTLQNVMVLSNRLDGVGRTLVQNVCDKLNLSLTFAGYQNPVWNVVDLINEADLVLGIGRSALEGMACARAVLLFDYLGGDGMVTKENYRELRKCNFSGRRYQVRYSEQDLICHIAKYSEAMGETNRQLILANHDLVSAVDKYLDVYEEAIKNKANYVCSLRGVGNEIDFYQNIIKTRNNWLRRKDNIIQSKKRRINELLNSRSWRLTAPLRKLAEWLNI